MLLWRCPWWSSAISNRCVAENKNVHFITRFPRRKPQREITENRRNWISHQTTYFSFAISHRGRFITNYIVVRDTKCASISLAGIPSRTFVILRLNGHTPCVRIRLEPLLKIEWKPRLQSCSERFYMFIKWESAHKKKY